MCDLLLSFVVQLRLYHRTYLLYLRMFFRRAESRIPYVYLVYRSKSLDLMGNVFDQLLSEHLLITEVLFLFRVIFFTKCIYPRASCVYNFLTVNFVYFPSSKSITRTPHTFPSLYKKLSTFA